MYFLFRIVTKSTDSRLKSLFEKFSVKVEIIESLPIASLEASFQCSNAEVLFQFSIKEVFFDFSSVKVSFHFSTMRVSFLICGWGMGLLLHSRLEICRDRRSCKIFPYCVNFWGNNANLLGNYRVIYAPNE